MSAPGIDRKRFLLHSLAGLGGAALCCAGPASPADGGTPAADPARASRDLRFVENWLTDLLVSVRETADEATLIRAIEGCGRGCYRRHAFKQEIAANSGGTVEGLVAAYSARFEAWRAEDGMHIRYGEVVRACYCPVLRDAASPLRELHCHCTKATHRAICSAALGREVEVEIVETLRRGGRTCHFLVRV